MVTIPDTVDFAMIEATAAAERAMTREQTAEWVGYYFGLQRAGNLKLTIPRGDKETATLNNLRQLIDAEMARIGAMLPPGTIDSWPRDNE